jgi:hypothetical chaperone protein
MTKPTIFAIDFGTSNSLLAAASADHVFAPAPVDPSATDPTVLRSVMFWNRLKQGGTFGSAAIQAFVDNGFRGRLIRSIKRHLPSRAFTKTRVGDQFVSLEDLVGAFLRAMRDRACAHFETDVRRVVLGRPARFSADDEEDLLAQTRLESAARKAGFEEISFCPEPIAAAYDFAEDLISPRNVLIADLGGGTTDYTIVRMTSKGFGPGDVLGIGGLSVAGDAIDGALVRSVVAPEFGVHATYRAPFGSNVLEMPLPLIELLCSPADLTLVDRERVLASLRDIRAGLVSAQDRPKLDRFTTVIEDGVGFSLYDAVEGAKRRLSDSDSASIGLDYPGAEFHVPASREGLELVAQRPIDKMMTCLDAVLAGAKLHESDIEIVCLTGGTSRVPAVEAAFRAKLPQANFRRLSSFHSVVQGLARHAQSVIS